MGIVPPSKNSFNTVKVKFLLVYLLQRQEIIKVLVGLITCDKLYLLCKQSECLITESIKSFFSILTKNKLWLSCAKLRSR